MTARGAGALAALVSAAIVVSAVVHETAERLAARSDPAARLPRGGLLAAISSDRFGSVLERLATAPVYRTLLTSPTPPGVRRHLGWPRDVPPVPWRDLRAARSAAVGFYDGGWLAVFPADEAAPALAGSRLGGGLRAVASNGLLLEAAASSPPTSRRSARRARGVRFEVDVSALASRWGRGGAASLFPARATGWVRASVEGIEEWWLLECSGPCVLDLLDPGGTTGSASTAWSALPEAAPAVAWFRVRPAALLGSPPAQAAAGFTLPRAVEALEAFLGILLRERLASALAGPVAVALLEEPVEKPPRLLAALELRRPDRLVGVLDRLAALGLLAGSAEVTTYRGVRIVSWSAGSRGHGLGPAIAVDGDTLLVSTHRADLAEGLDRRRRHERSSSRGVLEEWATHASKRSWRARSRSAWVLARWEEIVGGGSEAGPAPLLGHTCEAAMSKDGAGWVVEGRGAGPVLGAEFLVPCLRALLRGGAQVAGETGSPGQ